MMIAVTCDPFVFPSSRYLSILIFIHLTFAGSIHGMYRMISMYKINQHCTVFIIIVLKTKSTQMESLVLSANIYAEILIDLRMGRNQHCHVVVWYKFIYI